MAQSFCIHVNKKKLILIIAILLVLPLSQAVSIDILPTINTSVSNSSISLGIPITLDLLKVNSNYILLYNISYTDESGEGVFNYTTLVNWSETNQNINTSEFPHIYSSTTTEKKINSSLVDKIDSDVTFDVSSCSEVNQIKYTSHTGAYEKTYNIGEWTCASNRLKLNIIGIEQGANNILLINPSVAPPEGETTQDPSKRPPIPFCGNGVCDQLENYENCPEDCPKPKPWLEWVRVNWFWLSVFGLVIGGLYSLYWWFGLAWWKRKKEEKREKYKSKWKEEKRPI